MGFIFKRCSKCKDTKSISEFTKDRKNKDGIRVHCKSCDNAYGNNYRKTTKGKEAQCRKGKKYRKTERGKASRNRFKTCHSNQIKAGHAINDAILNGIIPKASTQQCQYCPNQAEQYHHWSYLPEHWLDVIPVCVPCHNKYKKKPA